LRWLKLFGKSEYYLWGESNWKPVNLDFLKDDDCSTEPKRLHRRDAIFAKNPDLRVGGLTVQWTLEFFESSEYINSQAFLGQIRVPVTIINAETDSYVDNSANHLACAEHLFDCQEVNIPNTRHCLTQEHDDAIGIILDEFDKLTARINGDPY